MGQLSDEWWALNRSAEGAFSRTGYERAIELWREALPLAEQLGESDDRYKKTITGVCRAMIMLKQDWDVIPWLFRSLELAERYDEDGIYNENGARITFRLAKTYRAYNMPTEAEEQFKRALAIHTKVYGAADSFTVEVLSEYAELLTELHREDEAQHMMYCAIGYMGGEWKPVSQHPNDVPAQDDYQPEQDSTDALQDDSTNSGSGFGRMLKHRQ
jgi:tetratricopeptide (TPR) repeat protein